MTATSTSLPVARESAGSRAWHLIRGAINSQEFILFIAIIALALLAGANNPRYLSDRNITTILQGNAYIAVAALGMSMIIISGNIDISIGGQIGVFAVIMGLVAKEMAAAGVPSQLAWLVPIALGLLVGLINGGLVAYLRVPAIVVTLAMASILRGGLLIFTRGAEVSSLPQEFLLSQLKIAEVPVQIPIMFGLTILVALWMRYSATGRAIYAVGGNAEAARLSGINYKRMILTVFMINGVFVGISTIMYATQGQIIRSTIPGDVPLATITACVVGGVSILGGTGTVIGATLAAILLNTITSAMIFLNISPFWTRAVQGVLILVTVLIDILRRRRQARRAGR
jgi:ribose/xylose/arabinose/galactoside ABC-type transport system permease subunit